MKLSGRENQIHIALAIAVFVAALVGYFLDKTTLPDVVVISIPIGIMLVTYSLVSDLQYILYKNRVGELTETTKALLAAIDRRSSENALFFQNAVDLELEQLSDNLIEISKGSVRYDIGENPELLRKSIETYFPRIQIGPFLDFYAIVVFVMGWATALFSGLSDKCFSALIIHFSCTHPAQISAWIIRTTKKLSFRGRRADLFFGLFATIVFMGFLGRTPILLLR